MPSLDPLIAMADLAMKGCTVTSTKHADGYWQCSVRLPTEPGLLLNHTSNNPDRIDSILDAYECVERWMQSRAEANLD